MNRIRMINDFGNMVMDVVEWKEFNEAEIREVVSGFSPGGYTVFIGDDVVRTFRINIVKDGFIFDDGNDIVEVNDGIFHDSTFRIAGTVVGILAAGEPIEFLKAIDAPIEIWCNGWKVLERINNVDVDPLPYYVK